MLQLYNKEKADLIIINLIIIMGSTVLKGITRVLESVSSAVSENASSWYTP